GELLQDLFLAVDLQRRNDGGGRDQIGEQHGPFPDSESAAGPNAWQTRAWRSAGLAKAADHKYPPVARQWASGSMTGRPVPLVTSSSRRRAPYGFTNSADAA